MINNYGMFDSFARKDYRRIATIALWFMRFLVENRSIATTEYAIGHIANVIDADTHYELFLCSQMLFSAIIRENRDDINYYSSIIFGKLTNSQ